MHRERWVTVSCSVRGRWSSELFVFADVLLVDVGGGVAVVSIFYRFVFSVVAIAMYGLMSVVVCWYLMCVDFASVGMTWMAYVRFLMF